MRYNDHAKARTSRLIKCPFDEQSWVLVLEFELWQRRPDAEFGIQKL